MTQRRTAAFLAGLFLLTSILFSSCKGTDTVPQATAAPEDSPITTLVTEALLTETETEAVTTAETEAAAEPEQIPERYTLRHTTHDLTTLLPERFLARHAIDEKLIQADTRGIQIYIQNVSHPDSKENVPTIYTFVPDGNQLQTVLTPVPLYGDAAPYYAYALSDGRFLMITKEKESPALCLILTDTDGTVLAQQRLNTDGQTTSDYLISEEENGDIAILVQCYQYLIYHEYHAQDNAFVYIHTIDQSNFSNERTFYMGNAQYFGNGIYRAANFRMNAVMHLDMREGTMKKLSVRIPEDRSDMVVHLGTDREVYLYDYEGLYLYQNDLPTKVLDWNEANIRIWDYRMWPVDENTFYFLKSKMVGGKPMHSLKCVSTERVPWEDPRAVIRLTSFDIQTDWLTNAIFHFNQSNENYRIDLHYVNIVDRSFEDINADLAEIMLYGEHPDMLLMTPTASKPLDIYYEKNIFVDLMPYFGDDLLTCAAEGIIWNGALYTLPTTMELQTFVCADTVTDSYLTWEKFHSVMDGISVPDSILTTEPRVINYIYNNGIMDFCDVGRAESYYDTDAFRDMLTYHQKLEDMIYEDVGTITRAVDQSYGYTRASLPAYLKEGNIKFLNVPIAKLNDILAPRLIYGDTDFTWCGYPSRDGGGAYLNYSRNMFSVFADSDVTNGCIEFLSYLLSEEQQCQPTLPYLPVTESGLRTLIGNNRWWYYEESVYEKYSDPNASLVEAPFYGALSALKYIPLRADGSSADRIEDYGKPSDDIDYEEEWMRPTEVVYIPVELTDDYADAFIDFLNNCHMKANVDNTLKSIITEEISFWEGSARTLEETTGIIDSRVWIYLNE